MKSTEFFLDSKDFKRLQTLSLSNTSFSSLNVSSFPDFRNLKELNLDHNQISTIDYGFFGQLQNLTFLSLANNVLKRININASVSLLRELHISYNEWSEICNFEKFKLYLPCIVSLELINLDGNDWTCTYLLSSIAGLKLQSINVNYPEFPVNFKINIMGIECNDTAIFSTLTEIVEIVVVIMVIGITVPIGFVCSLCRDPKYLELKS